MAGWLTERGFAGLPADSAYWLVLGGFSVAGGHVPSLLTIALTPTPTLALALTPALTRTLTLSRTLTPTLTYRRHVPSLHPGARVQCAVEGVRSHAVVLRVGHTTLLVTPDGGELPSPHPTPRECAEAVSELEPAAHGVEMPTLAPTLTSNPNPDPDH